MPSHWQKDLVPVKSAEASWQDALVPVPKESNFRNEPGPLSWEHRAAIKNIFYKPESQENYLRQQGYEVRRRQDPVVQGQGIQPSGELEYRIPGDPQGIWYPVDPTGAHGLGETVQDITDVTTEAAKMGLAQYGGGMIRAGKTGYGIIRQAIGAAIGQGSGEAARQGVGQLAGQPEFDPRRLATETATTGLVTAGMGGVGSLMARSGGVSQEAIRAAMQNPRIMGRPFGPKTREGEFTRFMQGLEESRGAQAAIKTAGRREMEAILEGAGDAKVQVLPTVTRMANAIGGQKRRPVILKERRISRQVPEFEEAQELGIKSPGGAFTPPEGKGQRVLFEATRTKTMPRENIIKVTGPPRVLERSNQAAQRRLDNLVRGMMNEADESGRIPIQRAEEILREQYRQPIAEQFDKEGGGAFIKALLKEQAAFREDIVKSLPKNLQAAYKTSSAAAEQDILRREIVHGLFATGPETKVKLGNFQRLRNAWTDADIGPIFRKALKDYDASYGTDFAKQMQRLSDRHAWSPVENQTFNQLGQLMMIHYMPRSIVASAVSKAAELPIGLARSTGSLAGSNAPEISEYAAGGVKAAAKAAEPYLRIGKKKEQPTP